jgi:rhodanese-related sulfurtransferase
MGWIFPVTVVLVIGSFLFLRQRGSVSAEEARRYLRDGALLVDVRTSEEFAGMTWPGGSQKAPGQRTAAIVITVLFALSAAMLMRIAYAGATLEGQSDHRMKVG